MNSLEQYQALEKTLLHSIHNHLEECESLFERCHGHRDYFYRLYYGSFKVYAIQRTTDEIVVLLRKMSPQPGKELCEMFENIYKVGTGIAWELEHNKDWETHTVPIVQAYHHALMFLEAVIETGKTIKEPVQMLPICWATVLCLYKLR